MIRREVLPTVILVRAETLARRAAALAALWRFRARTRAHLRDLPPHMLRDIGVDQGMADAEARKPFWR